MDQEKRDDIRVSDQFSVNSIKLGNGFVLNSKENELGSSNSEFGSSKALLGAQERVMSQEKLKDEETAERTSQVGQGSSRSCESSSDSVHGAVLETVIVINPAATAKGPTPTATAGYVNNGESMEVVTKRGKLGSGKVFVEKPKTKSGDGEGVNGSCVIDMKCSDGGGGGGFKESTDGEMVCRICHLSPDQSSDVVIVGTVTTVNSSDLIQLGCGCKDDLGVAHAHCAEAWFKLRGNRVCEICGQAAKNVTGVGDSDRFMEEWHDQRLAMYSSTVPDERGCWRGQPFCNFLMACLVISFVLPWFFRNMF